MNVQNTIAQLDALQSDASVRLHTQVKENLLTEQTKQELIATFNLLSKVLFIISLIFIKSLSAVSALGLQQVIKIQAYLSNRAHAKNEEFNNFTEESDIETVNNLVITNSSTEAAESDVTEDTQAQANTELLTSDDFSSTTTNNSIAADLETVLLTEDQASSETTEQPDSATESGEINNTDSLKSPVENDFSSISGSDAPGVEQTSKSPRRRSVKK
ncbi:hypothetical protein OsccyDRAFT_0638 [Leptolyngbyaceae cyanobacterium JSC-12]|nr:hypothetical protein OsccyDRAFT_0638 [Leptolyngbyaceae cyanobacterium JSC-12]